MFREDVDVAKSAGRNHPDISATSSHSNRLASRGSPASQRTYVFTTISKSRDRILMLHLFSKNISIKNMNPFQLAINYWILLKLNLCKEFACLVWNAVGQRLETVINTCGIARVTPLNETLDEFSCFPLSLLQNKSLFKVLQSLRLEAWQTRVHHK